MREREAGGREGDRRPQARSARTWLWRPTLGLLVLLSALILTEGVVTVGRIVLRRNPAPIVCSGDLQMRSDKWCQLETAAKLRGTVPSSDQFQAALGAQKLSWTLDSGYPDKIINASRFTVFATCRGTGELTIKVYQGATDVHNLTLGCAGAEMPEVPVPPAYVSPGTIYPGPYVISVAVTGDVTAAEYFIQ
jgi:hypothetical protein